MAVRFATKTVAGTVMCAALMLAGCQADTGAPVAQSTPQTAPIPAPVSAADVLVAVDAAATLRDLPDAIGTDELLSASGDYSDQWSIEGCDPSLETTRLDDLSACTLGDVAGARTMAVVGDSGAAMWHDAFDLVGKRMGWRVLMLTKSNCGPAALTYYQWQLGRAYTECDAWQTWRTETIGRENAEVVVLTGAFDGGNQGPDRPTTPQIWRDGLVQTIRALPAETRTVLLGNIPRAPRSPAECVTENPTDLTRCAVPAAEAVPDQAPWSEAAELTGQTYVDIDPWFCTEVCPAVIADRLVYAGRYHVAGPYAEYLSGAVEEALAPAVGTVG